MRCSVHMVGSESESLNRTYTQLPKMASESKCTLPESSEVNSRANPRVATKGCSVLLDINDGDKLTFARLNSSATLRIGGDKCSLTPMIGCPFGALFQVERGPKGPYLSRITAASKKKTSLQDNEDQNDHEKADNKDNRALVDNNTAQNLSSEEILQMRREGISGERIVEALIANSATFQNKTAFSQEKYKRKKQKKYVPRVLLRRPFTRSICEAYFNKWPEKIGFLRMDTLSLLLSVANVSAYADVLVLDMLGGLVTGAVAERMGGNGSVCNTYCSLKPPPMDIVGIFNFDGPTSSRVFRAPLYELISARNKHLEELNSKVESGLGSMNTSVMDTTSLSKIDLSSNGSMSTSEKRSDVEGLSSLENIESNPSTSEKWLCQCTTTDGMKLDQQNCDMEVTGTSKIDFHPNISLVDVKEGIESGLSPKLHKIMKAGRQATSEDILHWVENGFTSMIVAAPELDTWTVIVQLLPLLSFSAPFGIYHQYLQPLAECMHKLQAEHMAVSLQISEPWLREYQVLPSRTHPHMQMSSFGGYILSGIRVSSTEIQEGVKP